MAENLAAHCFFPLETLRKILFCLTDHSCFNELAAYPCVILTLCYCMDLPLIVRVANQSAFISRIAPAHRDDGVELIQFLANCM